ncbi:hypothetical protein NLI96_g10234 [Meripilus lineatus]|uniref:DUF6535 domain-containing protein n=1 Tax=Meripilus lineatus TaxID=2056292 RepID=A0AAD5UU03_9APHY|nr:hypothetical protein NLI96_g10234 [Physisporinus lineatus]
MSSSAPLSPLRKPTEEPPSYENGTGRDADDRQRSEPWIPKFERDCRREEGKHPDLVLESTNVWSELSQTLTRYDVEQIQATKENIDTLLVLAGLFLASVTAFSIESYKMLQPDPSDVSMEVLLQISLQLNSLSVTPRFINSTSVPASPPPFSPSPMLVWVNALWLSALLLSLATASLGLLVKQWLREYLSDSPTSPEQHCQIRMFRARGLRSFKVFEIADILPLLLQLSFALFFIGIIIFIVHIYQPLAPLVGILVGFWLLLIVITTLLPMVYAPCPYKTPFLDTLFRRFRRYLHTHSERINTKHLRFTLAYDQCFPEEDIGEMSAESKAEVLIDACDTLKNVQSWDIAARCIDLNSLSESLRMLCSVVNQRFIGDQIVSKSSHRRLGQAQLRILLKSMAICVRRSHLMAHQPENKRLLQETEAVACVSLRQLNNLFIASSESDRALKSMVFKLTEDETIFSVPHNSKFLSTYIWERSRLPPDTTSDNFGPDKIRNFFRLTIAALRDRPDVEVGFKCRTSLPHLLEICRISFLCAARTSHDDANVMRSCFLELRNRLTASLESLGECPVDILDALRSQYALDMAMKLNQVVQGIVDPSLFEALHKCSIVAFDSIGAQYAFKKHIKDALDKRGTSGGCHDAADWQKILSQGESVRTQGLGLEEYMGDFDVTRLYLSCRDRIKFLPKYIPILSTELNAVHNEFCL